MAQESGNSNSAAARRSERQRRAKRLAARTSQQPASKRQFPELTNPASKGKSKIREQDITGLKYFDQLAPLLKRLHDDGCERDTAGNRELHYDQYCMLILLFMFNPIVTSLRGIQQASELKKVQNKLGCPRAALGSLSEASSVFNPELLKEIIAELGEQLQPIAADSRLKDIQETVTLVDGTLLSALPQMMEASLLKQGTGSGMIKWRLHTHFELAKNWPVRMDLAPNGGGEHDERAMLSKVLESDRLYVMDRGYQKFTLFNQIVENKSSYVCRLRDNSVWETLEPRYRNDAAEIGEIISDEVVKFPNGSAKTRPNHPIRTICVRCNPHTTRGTYKGSSTGVNSDGILRIATNLLDVPADIIALIFSHRWAIEIFFRFFKHMLGCRKLLSRDADGIEIQTYCAIIALYADQLVDGPQANAANVRDDLFLLLRHGQRRRADEAHRKIEATNCVGTACPKSLRRFTLRGPLATTKTIVAAVKMTGDPTPKKHQQSMRIRRCSNRAEQY